MIVSHKSRGHGRFINNNFDNFHNNFDNFVFHYKKMFKSPFLERWKIDFVKKNRHQKNRVHSANGWTFYSILVGGFKKWNAKNVMFYSFCGRHVRNNLDFFARSKNEIPKRCSFRGTDVDILLWKCKMWTIKL